MYNSAKRFSSSLTDTLSQAHRALNEQNLPKAKTLFEKLIAEPNATIDTHYNLGVVEWLSKRPEEAVARWQRALQYEFSLPSWSF